MNERSFKVRNWRSAASSKSALPRFDELSVTVEPGTEDGCNGHWAHREETELVRSPGAERISHLCLPALLQQAGNLTDAALTLKAEAAGMKPRTPNSKIASSFCIT